MKFNQSNNGFMQKLCFSILVDSARNYARHSLKTPIKGRKLTGPKSVYQVSKLATANSRHKVDSTISDKITEQISTVFAGRRRGNRHIEAIRTRNEPEYITLLFKKGNVKRIASASSESQLPSEGIPEVCFAGRSNVGKSSILNSIARCGKAPVSERPGHTRTIDFYRVANHICLVDLPGYGFAFAKEADSDQWNQFVKDYISKRKSLKRVFLLVDCRHGLKEKDREFLSFLEKNKVTNQIIVTKTDLLFPDVLASHLQHLNNEIKAYKHTVSPALLSSSFTQSGVLEIHKTMVGMMDREKLSKLKDVVDKDVLQKNEKLFKPEKSIKYVPIAVRAKNKVIAKSKSLKSKK
jgi:ribosome biogenesis GTP-binding protein YsxC/EngB